MLLENLDRYKLSTTKAAVTSFAGLPMVLGMGRSLGLEEALDALPLKERDRGYRPAESIFSLMGLIQAGGVALDDILLLQSDEGLKALWGDVPASNTLGETLRRFRGTTVYRLAEVIGQAAVKVIRAKGLKRVTLDIDALMVESQKADVAMNYDGQWGYCPVMVSCAELKIPVAGLFRPGNASPMANLAGLLERVIEALKRELPTLEIAVRSDSAGYQAKVVRVCEESKVHFTITARKDTAVIETIGSIPRNAWRSYEAPAYPHQKTEITETVHAFGDKDLSSYRLIVLRWPKEDRDLFDESPYAYHAVLTDQEGHAELVMQFHRNRQDKSENVNKEQVGGFALSKLPCRSLMANAAYFQISMLAHVVFAAFKHLALPESWQTATIKTVRFRMIRLAGIVSQRARALWLKIPQDYPHLKVFEEAHWATLGARVWAT
jgi:Transposase DDE domain group 1